jgi:hypothetical protein
MTPDDDILGPRVDWNIPYRAAEAHGNSASCILSPMSQAWGDFLTTVHLRQEAVVCVLSFCRSSSSSSSSLSSSSSSISIALFFPHSNTPSTASSARRRSIHCTFTPAHQPKPSTSASRPSTRPTTSDNVCCHHRKPSCELSAS